MTQDLKSLIGTRVRAARKAKKLTQAALAEAISRTTEAISNIERGRNLPPLDRLQQIGEVLDISLADLVEEPAADGPAHERAGLEMEIRTTARDLPIEQLRVAARQISAMRDL